MRNALGAAESGSLSGAPGTDPSPAMQRELAGRGKARNRRAAVTAATSAAARMIQLCASLVTVPLTLKYLGAERFGLWMTISAVLAMAGFADFGIGSGLLNVVSDAYGKDDYLTVQRAISSGFAVMSGVAAALLLAFFVAYPWVNWPHFFGVTSAGASVEAGPAIAVFAVCFTLNIAIDVVQRVQLGLQQGYRYGMWQAVGSVLAFCGVLIGIHFRVSLPLLLGAVAGGPVLATLMNAAHFFLVARPDLRPRRRLVSAAMIRRVAKMGGMFFGLQVAASLAYSTDNFILARTLGAGAIAAFSIPQRMFGMVGVLVYMLAAPLWPAYGEAIARGDFGWVGRTLRRSLLIAGLGAGGTCLALVLLSPRLLRAWVGPSIHPSLALLVALGCAMTVASVGTVTEFFLNAAAVFRFQLAVAAVFGIGCVLLKVYCVRRFGAIGLPWAAVLSYLVLSAVPFAMYVPRMLRRMRHTKPRMDLHNA